MPCCPRKIFLVKLFEDKKKPSTYVDNGFNSKVVFSVCAESGLQNIFTFKFRIRNAVCNNVMSYVL